MQRDALAGQHLQQCGRDIGIFSAGEPRPRLDYRHSAAEPAIGLRQFQSDIAAADDDEVVGQSIELERLDIGQRLGGSEPRNLRDRRARADIDRDTIAGQHSHAAVVQTDLDRLWRNEPTRAHDQFGAAGLV
jgi:hypothetical protein